MSQDAVLGKMDVIAKSNDIEIYKEKGWGFSFFASPYIAHREFKAVDIYQGKDFGETALSPVSGEIFKILRFESPSIGESLPEYLTLVKKGDYLVRMMHIKPSVREGDSISAGDEIGKFISNGYFFFWVDANIHIEIRGLNNYLRARGGYELTPMVKDVENKIKKTKKRNNINNLESELKDTVINASNRNITVKLNKSRVVKIKNRYALMDCASSLSYGGVLGKFKLGDEVYFNGIKIGRINKVGNYMSIFKTEKLRVFVNEIEFKGISSMFGQDVVRLIPKGYGKPAFEEGDQLRIKLKSNENETG